MVEGQIKMKEDETKKEEEKPVESFRRQHDGGWTQTADDTWITLSVGGCYMDAILIECPKYKGSNTDENMAKQIYPGFRSSR